MRKLLKLAAMNITLLAFSNMTFAKKIYEKQAPPRQLTTEQTALAAANYQKYCVLCHGENREGHKNDHAPSLRAKSLFESGVPHSILRPISYGREGTAMGGYLDELH